MEKFFQILAVILIGVAAYFLWQRNSDGTFVASVLGAVAFFLSVRFQVKKRLKQREIQEAENADEPEKA
jgi:multisubunit Na+/H+ antiporter MnhC subunit